MCVFQLFCEQNIAVYIYIWQCLIQLFYCQIVFFIVSLQNALL